MILLMKCPGSINRSRSPSGLVSRPWSQSGGFRHIYSKRFSTSRSLAEIYGRSVSGTDGYIKSVVARVGLPLFWTYSKSGK